MFNCFSKLVVTLFKQFGLQCKKKCIKFSDLEDITDSCRKGKSL